MKRLLCFIIGHGDEKVSQDGKGAAWMTCQRCGKVTGFYDWNARR